MKYPSTQNAIVITGAGGPEVLELRELRVPKPGPQQVLIQVIAAGVNRHDCNQRAKGTHHDGKSAIKFAPLPTAVAMRNMPWLNRRLLCPYRTGSHQPRLLGYRRRCLQPGGISLV